MDAVLFHPETSTRRALILALGHYGLESFSSQERGELITALLDLYEHDADSGIHGSAEWTLRQLNHQETLRHIDQRLSRGKDQNLGGRRWYVNGQGQTMVIIVGPVEFGMGSPPTEPDRISAASPLIAGRSLASLRLPTGKSASHSFARSAQAMTTTRSTAARTMPR